MTDDATVRSDADADSDPPAAPTTSSNRRLSVVLAVAAVAFAALFALTFLDRARLDDELRRDEAIADVAGRFGVALTANDYQEIDGKLAALEALSTPSFAAEYREDFEANLRALIEERQVVSTSEITDVLVSRSEGDQARAIVIASTTVERPNGNSATVGWLIDLSMLEVDGEWLVDKVLTMANDGTITDSEGQPIDTSGLGDSTTPTSTGSVPPVPDDSVQEPADGGE